MTDTGEDLELALYRQLGLRSSSAGSRTPPLPRRPCCASCSSAPKAGSSSTRQGANLMNSVVGSAPAPASAGAVLHTFELADDRALRLWRDTLARTRQCLLITGRALGLDHPSLERIDILLRKAKRSPP